MGMTQGRGWLAGWAALAWVVSVGAQPTEPAPELRGEAARFHAEQRGLPTVTFNASGGLAELRSVKDNFPVYITQFNRESAQMMGTFDLNQLPSANPFGRNLRGNGILLGIWDAGRVYVDHPLFNASKVQLSDGYPFVDDHATHVAGTMVGLASVFAPAGGMADQADLWSYHWDNDTGEMRDAAADRMAVSNHSYGEFRGWDWLPEFGWLWFGDVRVNLREDYRFGFYSSESRAWDQVLHANPYLVAVSAAGNSRDLAGPANGFHYYIHPETGFLAGSTEPRNPNGNGTGFDTLSGAGVAKNGITVGGITGASASSPFSAYARSSWGPTDDGRIKPDICAKAVDVLSAGYTLEIDQNGNLFIDESVYIELTGTSMASPGIAGSLALVHEFWNRTVGGTARPLSATVRALVAHTAQDLPLGANDGPDYRFGWGLLDTVAIIDTIAVALGGEGTERNAAIFEKTLQEDVVDSYVVIVDPGDELAVTLAWNDPPGQPVPRSLNPRRSMLVNNLELEVIRLRDGVTYYPYRLDVTQRAERARTDAPNAIDNIERIDAPTSGVSEVFEVLVHHTDSLRNNRQDYSLVITGGLISGTTGAPLLVDRPPFIEEGGSESFGVRLPDEPAGTVTVTIQNLTSPSPVSVNPASASLLFDASNWDQPQTVVLDAALDAPANGCVETAVFEIIRSDLIDAVTLLPVRTTDEDLEVVLSATGIAMTEGVAETIGIRLTDTPCIPVRVNINQVSGSPTVKITPEVVIFDDLNYNVEQTLRVEAELDPGDYRDEQATFEVLLEDRSRIVPIAVNVTDADPLELVVGTSSLSVDEGTRELRELGSLTAGRRVPIALNLPPAPGETLIVQLERTLDSDPDIYLWDRERNMAVTSLSFSLDATNWQTPRELLFVASEDGDSVNGSSFFRVSYIGLPNPNRYGQVITMTELDANVLRPVVENASGEAYRQAVFPNMTPGIFSLFVRLNADPGQPVTVTARPLNGVSAFRILNDPAEFAFDSSNWNVPQRLDIEVSVDSDAVQDNLRLEISGTGMPELVLEMQELERLSFNSPAAPALKEPPNNALVTTDSIVLRWSPVELADTYDVYVSNTPVPVGDAATQYTVVQPSLELNDLGKGLTYYWRVIANNPAGSTPSPIFRFATPSQTGQDVNPPDDDGGNGNPSDDDASQDPPSDGADDDSDTGGEQQPTSSGSGICGGPVLLTLMLGLLVTYPRRRTR